VSTEEIGNDFGFSYKSAKNSVSAVIKRLGVADRTAAVTLWIIANSDHRD
jgi:DNA-binding NarL/FixJ family response regulator